MCAVVVSVMQLGYCLQLVMRSWVHEQQKTGFGLEQGHHPVPTS